MSNCGRPVGSARSFSTRWTHSHSAAAVVAPLHSRLLEHAPLVEPAPSGPYPSGLAPDGLAAASAGRVAFAFQGGGAMAATQVGMLWALTEAAVVPDLVVGSSAGALNALAYASNPTLDGLDSLDALWNSLRRKHVAPLSARGLLGGLIGRHDGLVSPTAMRAMLQRGVVVSDIHDATIEAHVVATDLATGEPVVLSDGDTVTALLASSAFPGLYPPVAFGSRHLIDGGVSADTPILQAEQLGATTTYVLPAAISDDVDYSPRGALPLAFHALSRILEAAGRRDAASARGVVHVLPAPASRAGNPVDFRDTTRLVDEGYQLAAAWLSGRKSADAAVPAITVIQPPGPLTVAG